MKFIGNRKNILLWLMPFSLGACLRTGWIDPSYVPQKAIKKDIGISSEIPVQDEPAAGASNLGNEGDEPANRQETLEKVKGDSGTSQAGLSTIRSIRNTSLGDRVYSKPKARKKLPVPQKNRKPIVSAGPVRYSGNRFVREVKKVRGKQTVVLSIQGNARLRQGNSLFKASSIHVYGEKGNYARAIGRLVLTDFASGSTLTAGYGEYFRNLELVRALRSPRFVNKNRKTGRKTILTATVMERSLANAKTYCRGNVRVQSGDFVIFADIAEYWENENKIVLKGDPRIYGKDNLVLAETIVLENSKNKIYLHKNVTGFFTDGKAFASKNTPPKEDDSFVISSILRADEGIYEYGKGVYLGRKLTLTGKARPVRLERLDATASAQKVTVWGPEGEEIQAQKDVVLYSKENNIRAISDNLHFYKVLGRAVMKAAKNRPRIISYDAAGNEKAVISGEQIERTFFSKKVLVKGDVLIESPQMTGAKQKEQGNENKTTMQIKGDWAQLDESKQIMIVYGNPRLKNKSGVLRAREIWLFAKTGRYELHGNIYGGFQP